MDAYKAVQADVLAGRVAHVTKVDLAELARSAVDNIHRAPGATHPSVKDLKRDVLDGDRDGLALDIHHLFQRHWFRKLYRERFGEFPTESLENEMPGYPLWIREHRRGRGIEAATFHDHLDSFLRTRVDRDLDTLMEAHAFAYQQMDLEHLWPATRDWLQGVLAGSPLP